MLKILHAVCPCGRQSLESNDKLGTEQKKNPETHRLLATQQSTSSFQPDTPTSDMAAATLSEGSFRHIEPCEPVGASGTYEAVPTSPTSPMSDSMRPISPEGLMSDEEDMDGIEDARKKKRFRPFKSIRKLFKKKRTSKTEDEMDVGIRSKSTGELNLSDMEERMFDPKQPSATMSSSLSESSVFVPDKPSLRSGEKSVSTEHISKDFAKDLSAMLAKRKSPDRGDVRISVEDVAMKTDETISHREPPTKEKSFDDSDVTSAKLKEPKSARRAKSMISAVSSPWSEKRAKYTTRVGDPAYLDLDVVKTSPNGPLSHSAAKHKMSVKPKTRRATTRGRISSQNNKHNDRPHDSTFNDSSFSSSILGDSSIISKTVDESNTSSLLEVQQTNSESLPVNEETYSTCEKNTGISKSEASDKEVTEEDKPQKKWSPPTTPRYAVNKSKELTISNESRKPMQKNNTEIKALKENTKFDNNDKEKLETGKTEQREALKPVIIVPLKQDLPSHSILTPSELVIRNKPVDKTEEERKVEVKDIKMSDGEEEEQPRKSVRDRILLFQNTVSRNNSNNSSPIQMRKIEIEVADKNGNKEVEPLTITPKDSANGNNNVKSNEGETSETSNKEQVLNQQNRRPVNKRSFMPKTDNCIVCSKVVYINEMSRSEGKVFHKSCQKCVECARTLQIGNVLLVHNKLYCRLHGSQEKMKLLKMRSEVE